MPEHLSEERTSPSSGHFSQADEGSSGRQNPALKPRGHGRVRFPPLFSSSPTNLKAGGSPCLPPEGRHHKRLTLHGPTWFRPAALPPTEGGVGTGAVEHCGREEPGAAPRFRTGSGDRGIGAVHWESDIPGEGRREQRARRGAMRPTGQCGAGCEMEGHEVAPLRPPSCGWGRRRTWRWRNELLFGKRWWAGVAGKGLRLALGLFCLGSLWRRV